MESVLEGSIIDLSSPSQLKNHNPTSRQNFTIKINTRESAAPLSPSNHHHPDMTPSAVQESHPHTTHHGPRSRAHTQRTTKIGALANAHANQYQ